MALRLPFDKISQLMEDMFKERIAPGQVHLLVEKLKPILMFSPKNYYLREYLLAQLFTPMRPQSILTGLRNTSG